MITLFAEGAERALLSLPIHLLVVPLKISPGSVAQKIEALVLFVDSILIGDTLLGNRL